MSHHFLMYQSDVATFRTSQCDVMSSPDFGHGTYWYDTLSLKIIFVPSCGMLTDLHVIDLEAFSSAGLMSYFESVSTKILCMVKDKYYLPNLDEPTKIITGQLHMRAHLSGVSNQYLKWKSDDSVRLFLLVR